MGVPKGTDNFKSFRAARLQTSIDLLRSELERARRRKMPYPDMATLISDMSARTKIHRTTLVRNPVYHRLLLEYLARQAGGSVNVSDKDAPPELLRAKLIDAKMEIGALNEQLAVRDRLADSARTIEQRKIELSKSDSHSAYADTVWAFRAVLDHINADGEVYVVDLERGEIRDLASAHGRQVVVSGPRLRPFLDALKRLREQER